MGTYSSYNPPKPVWNDTLNRGHISEQIVARFYSDHEADVTKADYTVRPYDLDVSMNGRIFTVEVKTFGLTNCTTLFAETFQNGSQTVPEYLTHSDEIDRIVWFNRITNVAYFFDCKRFAAYVQSHKKREWSNSHGTARGIYIEQDCKDAGFLYSHNLGAYLP